MMTTSRRPTLMLLLMTLTLGALTPSCGGPTYVRGDEMPELDSYAMSLRLDKVDLQKLYKANIDKMLSSSIIKQWERSSAMGNPPVVAIFPMRNETSEHIDDQLDTLLSTFETDLVNKSPVDVVDLDRQPQLINEIKRQQSTAYDPQRLSQYGRQLGAQYFVTGKVYDIADRSGSERRVQYSMFVQIVSVETGAIKFQNKSQLTKGLVK